MGDRHSRFPIPIHHVTFLVLALLVLATVGTPGKASAAIEPLEKLVIPDPDWEHEPPDHNTFPPTDLTSAKVYNDAESLIINIPFQSEWQGLQLTVILETNFDAAGATRDPFMQPVTYVHDQLPDYAMTCKYSSDDYGDFRRWNPAAGSNDGWEWFDPVSNSYDPMNYYNVEGLWTSKDPEAFHIAIPWAPFGGRPDSLRVEVYLTQDDGDEKRSAFDSAPSDATLDLDFDYQNPQPGDWDTALEPVFLSAWSEVYRPRAQFPAVPEISDLAAEPDSLLPGHEIQLTAAVTDAGDGIGPVVCDLSPLGGEIDSPLLDDGDPMHGDLTAGDGIFSGRFTVPRRWSAGSYLIASRAYDIEQIAFHADTCRVVIPRGIPLLGVRDPEGDDHGPNQPQEPGLYTTYPSNPVFHPGAFDITGFALYRTSIVIGGTLQDRLAFTVRFADLPDPSVPGNADWDPFYAGLNLEKVDILLDTAPGGATASLPNRGAAYQPWDGWEYAIILDGWYKAVIPSLGSNDLADWRNQARTSDQDIILVSDFTENTVTAMVDPAIFGTLTADSLRSWDICVQVAGHDTGGDEVLGGIRWVNEIGSQWGFGGGSNSNQDANLIDVLMIPGTGHDPGRPQESILDYTSAEAQARFNQGLTAVALEMTADPGVSGLPEGRRAPASLSYPNPFNARTTIHFELPRAMAIDLGIFDVAGRRVRTLLDRDPCAPGPHDIVWDGLDGRGRSVPSGVYFYSLQGEGWTSTRRMMTVK